MENINGGVTDARNAVNNTIGNPQFANDLRRTIANINAVTGLVAKRHDAMDSLITNLDVVMGNLREVSAHVKGITGGMDPQTIPDTLHSLTGAIASMTEVVEQIKKEPVLALSINKAADRIVKMKFDEMAKTQHLRTSGFGRDQPLGSRIDAAGSFPGSVVHRECASVRDGWRRRGGHSAGACGRSGAAAVHS